MADARHHDHQSCFAWLDQVRGWGICPTTLDDATGFRYRDVLELIIQHPNIMAD